MLSVLELKEIPCSLTYAVKILESIDESLVALMWRCVSIGHKAGKGREHRVLCVLSVSLLSH